MATDLMVDLETLSSERNAVIVSIGAVAFDVAGNSSVAELISAGLHIRVEMASQRSRHIDPDTVAWWIGMSKEAQEEVIAGNRVQLHEALHHLRSFVKSSAPYGDLRVWSHGSDFDMPILYLALREDAIEFPAQKAQDSKYPWPRNMVRDTRTVFWLVREFHGLSAERACWPINPIPHNPMSDAATQAVAVQSAYRVLRRKID